MIAMPSPANLHLEIQAHRKNHYVRDLVNRGSGGYHSAAPGDFEDLKVVEKVMMPNLVQLLSNHQSDLRASAAETIGDFGCEPELAVPALARLLSDPELGPRYAAAQALGKFGPQAKAAVETMVKYAQRAKNASERESAIAALKRVD